MKFPGSHEGFVDRFWVVWVAQKLHGELHATLPPSQRKDLPLRVRHQSNTFPTVGVGHKGGHD